MDIMMTMPARSPKWSACRDAHLKVQPVCQACGTKHALNVHHIKPYHLFPELELDQNNLITLCEGQVINCHLLFGHLMDWSSYNPSVVQDALRIHTKILHRITTNAPETKE